MYVPPSEDIHPFLKGNFAPVTDEFISHACSVTGPIPDELLGGQYIRNGGNPVYPPEKGRHYHWFDGDGMLHGVLFPHDPSEAPTYTNRHLATPLLTLTLILLRSPIPSIALLISPLSSLHRIVMAIVQAFFLLLRARMGVLSVANTSVLWWGQGMGSEAQDEVREREDRQQKAKAISAVGKPSTSISRNYRKDQRLLATCESGPPLEVRVPELETVGWDRLVEQGTGESLANRRGRWDWWKRWSLARVQEDWMTAHPRVDPIDGSLISYSTQMFDAPHARYSVIDRRGTHLVWKEGIDVGRAKMMHDFATTRSHTILLNLPLTLAPANLFSFPPVPLIHFDRSLPSEFVIFPRLLRSPETPQEPVRFTEPEPSLIFHTANAWDEHDETGNVVAIHMLGCRFKSAKLVYAAGQVKVPETEMSKGEDDVVRLHYYRFQLPDGYATNIHTSQIGTITHSFPLTAIPFEFPTVPPNLGMLPSRFVYGCTMRSGSFDERLGGAAKVDCLVKIDVLALAEKGRHRGEGKNMTPVDPRSSAEIMDNWARGMKGPVEIFALPEGWFAQEPRFIPKHGEGLDEDDGWLLSYVYDESHLLPDGTPSTASHAGSELWVIDAKRMGEGMSALACRVKLPQRVPYGLHGTWLAPTFTRNQRRLSTILPPQKLLQDKLALSRIQHFASVLFDRPTSRDKSNVERMVLSILWPAAFGALTLALVETLRNVIQGTVGLHGSASGGNITSTNWALDDGEKAQRWSGGKFPWPQVLSAFVVIMVFVLRASGFEKGEKVNPLPLPLPPVQEVE
ncbi:retinal pigment epithelial membrane protein-domain-containing protein [Naematelia encephala]|uniref:Retinal pigment epithelial membrane protein-domain-containing protein n=1 Tax=Naematelia encephala TaxID=71784 RepID=A0A1Y2AKF7_9TREE|nr:retinal pigment epithelial membrane protein-domain-containing protein [Naematelia encephala]